MKSFKDLVGRDSNPTRARHVQELLHLSAAKSLAPWLRAQGQRVADYQSWEHAEYDEREAQRRAVARFLGRSR